MAVKIRLQRFGAKKRAYFRLVAVDSHTPRDGKFLEILGTYDPLTGVVNVDSDKASKWIENGAQPTETVRSLFKKFNVLEKK